MLLVLCTLSHCVAHLSLDPPPIYTTHKHTHYIDVLFILWSYTYYSNRVHPITVLHCTYCTVLYYTCTVQYSTAVYTVHSALYIYCAVLYIHLHCSLLKADLLSRIQETFNCMHHVSGGGLSARHYHLQPQHL